MRFILFIISVLSFNTYIFSQELTKEVYADGKLKAEGLKLNGMKTGLWKYYYPNQVINAEEMYKDDLLNGRRNTYDFDGHLQSIENWSNGVQQDSTFEFHSNGKVFRKGIFKDGLYEGVWVSFYDNGQMKNKGSYTFGNPEGQWTFWNDEGMKTHEGIYQNGTQNGLWKMYNDKKGFLEFEGQYKNGEKAGEWLQYNSKGKELRKISY